MATATVTLPQLSRRADGYDPDALDPRLYLPVWRPWLALYGARVRSAGTRREAEVLAPIQALLPEELIIKVFSLLPVHTLAAAACVCHQWRAAGEAPALWRRHCLTAFSSTSLEENLRILKTQHKGRWRDMYLDRPHLRFDGLYVSRNTYIKRGIVEWRVKNACHVVCYYRYCRFLSDGTLLYRTSPEILSKVAKSMADIPPNQKRRREESVSSGRYYLDGDRLYTKVVYPNHLSTEIRTRLRVRSTVRGAHNRLDLDTITSFDHADGRCSPLHAFGEDDEADGEARQHKRGMSPYVFVPWEQVATHILNRSVDEMDVWVPG